jgi:hypothetical protein
MRGWSVGFVLGLIQVANLQRGCRQAVTIFVSAAAQRTFVDGGSAYLHTGGLDLRLIKILVDPSWPAAVSLELLRHAHRLAERLHCGLDPPPDATGDDVSRSIDTNSQ